MAINPTAQNYYFQKTGVNPKLHFIKHLRESNSKTFQIYFKILSHRTEQQFKNFTTDLFEN